MHIRDASWKNKFVAHGGTCQHCGREILPRRLRGKIVGRDRQFCSDACRQAAFRYAKLPSACGLLMTPRRKSRFALTLESDRAGVRGLRAILKRLLRRYGFRCVDAREVPPNAERAPDASPAPQKAEP